MHDMPGYFKGGAKMRIRQSAIYYEKLADILDELCDEISDIRDEITDTDSSYLTDKLKAYLCLTEQLGDLCYEG